VTGDSYKKILQCHFLNGTEHNTCFIEVEGDDQPLSGSDVYNFSKLGNHTLRVYDDRAQRDVGAKPAKVLNITIGDVPREKNGEVGAFGVCVSLLVFSGGWLLLYCKLHNHTRMEVPALNEDKAENNDSQQHGSAVDDSANVVHQETALEDGKDDLEVEMGELVRRTWTTVSRRYLLCQRVTAHHRSDENHVAIRIEEPECNNKSIKDHPTTEGQQVSSDAEKEAEVTVEGVDCADSRTTPRPSGGKHYLKQ
jgi:hypothetical protein